MTREEIVRTVLVTMAGRPPKEIAEALGLTPSYVRDIRSGRKYRAVLPEIPRHRTRKYERQQFGARDLESQEALVRDALDVRRLDSSSAIARDHGVTRAYVSAIRRGKVLEEVLPQLRRFVMRRGIPCPACVFFEPVEEGVDLPPCQLRFPEAGGAGANDCPAFSPAVGQNVAIPEEARVQ